MKNKLVWVWLLILLVPVVLLVAVQVDTTSAPSIGGGGYDLGPFLYSWALIIVTAVWSLCTMAAALVYRDRAAAMRAWRLSVFGVATFIAVLLLYRGNLH